MASDGSVTITITGDAKEFESELKDVQASLKKLNKDSETSGKSGSNVGSMIAKGCKIAAAAISAISFTKVAKDIVDVGISFESAFAGVKKTVNATDEQLATLRDGIRQMAKEMPTSADEIAAVAEAAGQLGIQTDNILSFTETMVMLGDSTNLSADEAATSLARLANITGMSQTDFDKLGSVIVALGNNLATTESEITEMGLRIAGAGAQVGMSEADIMSFSAALSSVGIEAEAGGSAFSTLISNMSLATQTGGEDLQQFADVAGMTADEFKTAFEQDASGAILSFIQGLGQLDANGGSAIATLDEMGLSDIRMRDALLRAAGASDTFTEALQLGSDAWEENTALANEAEQRYATAESKIEILKNNVADLGISIYDSFRDSLVGVVDMANDSVGQLSDAFSSGGFSSLAAEFLQQVPEMISCGAEMIHGLAEGLKTSLPELIPAAMEALVTFSGSLRESVGQLVDAGLELITVLAQSLIDNLPVFIETIPTIITNIAGIINDNAPKLLATGVTLLGQLALGLIQAIPVLIANIPEILQAIASVFMAFQWATLGKNLINAIKNGITSLKETIPAKMKEIGSSAIDKIKSINWTEVGTHLIQKIVSGIQTLVSNIPDKIHEIGEAALDKIIAVDWAGAGKNIVDGIISGITNFASRLTDKVRSLASGALDAIKEKLGIASPSKVMADEVGKWIPEGIANGITQGAGSILEAMFAALTGLPETIRNSLSSAIQAVAGWATEFGTSALQAGQQFLGNLGAALIGLPAAIGGWLSGAISTVAAWVTTFAANALQAGQQFVQNVVSFVQQLPGRIAASLSAVITRVVSWASNMIAQAQQAGQQFVQNVVSAVTQLPGRIASILSNIISRIASWASNMVSRGRQAASQFTNAVVSGLKSIPGKVTNIGSQIVHGLWSGISGAASWLRNKVTSFAQGIVSNMQSALKINSPSKVVRDKIGKAIPEGLAVGIDRYTKMATSSATDMAKQVVSSAAVSAGRISLIADTQTAANNAATNYYMNKNIYSTNGKNQTIDYHPTIKCDEPVSARKQAAIQRAQVRSMRRALA